MTAPYGAVFLLRNIKMRFLDCNGNYLGVLEEAKELPKSIIRSVIIETPGEEQQLRLVLTGAVKVDEHGCHTLGRHIDSNRKVFGDGTSKDADLKFNYSLDEKLRIIDTLASALKGNSSVIYPYTEEAEKKLLALVQSI